MMLQGARIHPLHVLYIVEYRLHVWCQGHRGNHGDIRPGGQTKDYHIQSVEEYIGDSGQEFEGAAEQIVESYMGEYMQVVMVTDH